MEEGRGNPRLLPDHLGRGRQLLLNEAVPSTSSQGEQKAFFSPELSFSEQKQSTNNVKQKIMKKSFICGCGNHL